MKSFFIRFGCFLSFVFVLSLGLSFGQTYSYPVKGNRGFNFSEKTRGGLHISYSIGEFSLNEVMYRGESMSEISISALVLPNEAGCPNLPVESRLVAIPQGSEARLEVISCDTAVIRNVNIAPALRIQTGDEEPDMNYAKNESVYSKNAFYPENPLMLDTAYIRGVDAIAVSVSPFQYNPVTKELKVFTNLELSLKYEGGNGHFGDDRLRSLYWDPILMQNLANYDQLPVIDYEARMQEWINNRATGWEYLIIIPTNENFRAPANELRDFRIAQGIKTRVVTLAEIGCVLTPYSTQLKNYIHNAYNNWDIPPAAVLLLGDHSIFPTSGIMGQSIPHPSPDIDNCITDNGYADVSGDNLPDIVFSRLVAANSTEAQMMVNKQIEYEYTNVNNDASTYDHPITATGWQTERWFQICNEVVGGYWRNQGKHPVRINAIYSGDPGNDWSTQQNTNTVVGYFGPSGRGYIPASPATLGGWTGGTAAQVVQAVNNGAFILQHSDHANPTQWGRPFFNVANVRSLTNANRMSFLVANDCSSGNFNHSTDCLAEAFMRHTYNGSSAGAVGCIAPTSISFSFVNDVFLWGMYDLFDGDFMPDMGAYEPAGDKTGNWMPAFGNVAGKYFLSQSAWPYNTSRKLITYQINTAHCDAFLRLYTQVPSAFAVSVPDHINANTTSISLTAPQGSTIALTNDNNIIALAIGTGYSQTIYFASQPTNSTIKVVVTKQNYIRSEAEIEVWGFPLVFDCHASVGENSVTLTAEVHPRGVTTSYMFDWGETESYGHSTPIRTISSNLLSTQTISESLSGLQSDRTYHYRLTIQNQFGVVQSKDYYFHTLSPSNNPPTIPQNPNPPNGATEIMDYASLSWTSTDPDGDNTNYNLYLGTSPSNLSLHSTGSGTEANNVGFDFGTTYFWKVVSYDNHGNYSDMGPVWQFTTTQGDVPVIVSSGYTNVSSNSVTFTGRINPRNLDTYYYFQYGTTTAYGKVTDTYMLNGSTSSSNISINANDLTPGQTYHYRLVAFNDKGETLGGDKTFNTAQGASYQIYASASPSSGGSVTGAGSYYLNETCCLEANPNSGYQFVNWTKNGSEVSTNPMLVFQVTQSATYVANFQPESEPEPETETCLIEFELEDSYGDGWNGNYLVVECSDGSTRQLTVEIENGSSASYLVPIPDLSHVSLSWIQGNYISECSFVVKYANDNVIYAGLHIDADFSYDFYVDCNSMPATRFTVSAEANPHYGGNVYGAGSYLAGRVCVLRASAKAGYVFSNWTENGTVVSTDDIYRFNVEGNRSLVANFTEIEDDGTGVLPGVFSVGDNVYVNFSKGNLQYQASTDKWRFAVNQYDYVGSDNANVSSTYSGWVDLFCWGTSGYAHGAQCYQPWSTSMTMSDYYAYGSETCNLYDQTGKADWGYNKISNGGDTFNTWRTLKLEEWSYLLNTRSTASGIRYAKAFVGGKKGLILLPDDWNSSYYNLNNTNTFDSGYNDNLIDASDWENSLEVYGAVFLPAAGMRYGTQMGSVSVYGLYWSSSYVSSDFAGYVVFGADRVVVSTDGQRSGAISVRLVKSIQNTAYNVSVTSNPSSGGTVSGGGVYGNGEYCTIVATEFTGYCFSHWTKNGIVVSNDATYSFPVTEDATYEANFYMISYSISASADPSAGGAVSGAGLYSYGISCTLTAAPNAGYTFVSWKKNGSQVSMDPEYTFTVVENATYVAEFTLNSYNITVSANPSAGGLVSGAGWHNYGSTCTLTAEANAGYSFVHWKRNGSQVSTNATYSFTVTGDASCVAVFSLNSYTISASASPSDGGSVSGAGAHNYGSTCTLTAEPNADYTFVRWTRNGTQVSTDPTYSFMVTSAASYVAWFEQNSSTNVTHAQSLAGGWNWWSTYIDMEETDGLTQLENSLGANGRMIKSRSNGYVESYDYNGITSWFGQLSSIRNDQMYKINMNASGDAMLYGNIVGAYPITINGGWNWIGFPMSQPVSVDDAMRDFNPSADDVIKGRNSYATYFSYNGNQMWFGTLNTLEPGCGYMYQSLASGTKTLVFQPSRGGALSPNVTPEGNVYRPQDESFPDNMTVTAVVELYGEELRSDVYELSAFVGDQCRGSVRLMYVESLDRYVAFLTVFGNQDEELEFRLTDGVETMASAESLAYVADGVVGTLFMPEVLRFGPVSVEEASTVVRIYPNPTRELGELRLSLPLRTGKVSVEIVNMLGERVFKENSLEVADSIAHIFLPGIVKPGAYVLKAVTQEGIVYYGKLVVE